MKMINQDIVVTIKTNDEYGEVTSELWLLLRDWLDDTKKNGKIEQYRIQVKMPEGD